MPAPPPHDTDHTIPTGPQRLASTPMAHLPPGTKVASYTITQLIGLGGMGAVYAATQDKPSRTVALKLIRPGHATEKALRRFEYEAEILGRLHHPGIASIHEAGIADTPQGRQPFFAMELVRGRPLTTYAGESNLSTRERLALFTQVCDAVSHAHQRGVIHRDIKPTNILVTPEGVARVLDFGVARATDADLSATTLQTNAGQIVGTLQYMSPEQAAGDPAELDTRADIYALGVTLYELLTGRLPHDLGDKRIDEAVRIILNEEPRPISSIDKVYRGDIQTILSTALAREKTRRYPTAAALGADIRRFLDDQPIAARPPSAAYQLSKFARRNKPLVFGAAAVVVALLIGLAGTSIALMHMTDARDAERAALALARDEAERARTEASRAHQVSQILQDMLRGIEPGVALGRDTTILREIFDRTTLRADDLPEQPLVELSIRGTLGIAYLEIGVPDEAERQFRRALELASEHLGENARETANIHNDLALALREQSRIDEAEGHFKAAEETLGAIAGPDDRDLLSVRQNLALIAFDRSHFTDAEPILRDVAERRTRTLGPDDENTIATRSLLSSLLLEMGNLEEGEPILRDTIERSTRVLGHDHPRTIIQLNNLSQHYERLGRYDEAEPILVDLLETTRRVHGNTSPTTAIVLNNLGGVYESLGRPDDAEPHYREALEIALAVFGENHNDTARSLNNLASIHEARHEYDEAEALYLRTLAIRRELLGPDHPDTLGIANNLAFLYRRMERYDEAEPLFRQARDGYAKILGEDNPSTIIITSNLAELLRMTGRLDEALTLHAQTIERFAGVLPESHWLHHQAHLRHAMTLRDMGRYAEAEPEMVEAYEGLAGALGASHERATGAAQEIATLYERWVAAEPDSGRAERIAPWRDASRGDARR